MSQTIAAQIVDLLVQAGVRRIFGVAGDSLNALTDAVRVKEGIEWISVRHEEVAAMAAGAEAEISGSLAVCAGSCGPGNLHLINGLYDCHRSKVPVLAIAAHLISAEIGTQYFQETHPERLFVECSHFCETLFQPDQMPHLVEIAIQKALALRGVSVLILPGDVAWKKVEEAPFQHQWHFDSPSICPSNSKLEEVADVLNQTKKVTILAGLGCANAREMLLATADVLKAPIVHTLRSKEYVEYNNPFDVGLTGLIGFSSGYQAMMDCDTLLMLGTDFPYRQFYPKDATIIQVDLRGENIAKRTHVDHVVVGDVNSTLTALLPRLTPKADDFLKTTLEHYEKARQSLDDLAVETPDGRPIHPQYLTKLIDQMANATAIFTCDVGTPTIWAARYLTMNGKRKLLGSFNHGTMATALPQAIGAQFQCPERQVITLSGDGGLAMLMGDLITLKQYHLPVKVIVFNNSAYSFVELEMKAAGILEYGTELQNPNFSQVAQAIGLFGQRVENASELKEAIKKALDHPGPALVEVMVSRFELSMPPTVTMEQAYGFGVYGVKAILNGRGDQVIELVRTNLWHS